MKRIITIIGLLATVLVLSSCVEEVDTTYTVHFISNGGTVVEDVIIEQGATIVEPDVPVQEGKEFLGWFSDSTFNVPYDFASGVNGNLTLYAKWEEIIITYIVTFMSGSESYQVVNINEGQQVDEPTNPSKEGFEFDGWYVDDAFTNQYDFSNGIEDNLFVFAKWNEIVEVHTVTFYETTSFYNEVDVSDGSTVAMGNIPTMNGYQFTGWYIDSELTTLYDFETVVTGDISLFAGWAQVSTCAGEPVNNDMFTIALVTDVGGIDDNSYNQNTWEGIVSFAEDIDLPESNYCYLTSNHDSDYETNMRIFIDEDIDLIVVPGFLFYDVLIELAREFPEQQFAIMDTVVDEPNVVSAIFSMNEMGFVAGVSAALKAQEAGEDTVGFIGGMDFGLIQQFEAGYEAGVWAVDPTITVLVDYAGTFADSSVGYVLANKQYDEGAYVIFHVSGGTGNGIIAQAKERTLDGDERWVIGVDVDQYSSGLYDGEHSVVLTSSIKKLDFATQVIALLAEEGNFPGGNILAFNLTTNGVGLPAENPNLSTAMLEDIETYIEGVVDGTYFVPIVPSRLRN